MIINQEITVIWTDTTVKPSSTTFVLKAMVDVGIEVEKDGKTAFIPYTSMRVFFHG